ncbi:MAG TPA: GTP-binding protein [Ktedonobacteraceae bacterium]|nr:GTP-binding protein [Ktedonobacteraceae bacterium]
MATKKSRYSGESEEQKRLKKDVVESITRPVTRPRSLQSVGLSLVKNLPSNINMVQNFMKVVNWKQVQAEVQEALDNKVVIVGQPNTGKSTLFNKIIGQMVSPASAEAGTTKTLVQTDFGPFTLVDTPGHLPDVMESGMDQASVVVFLLDASRGLQEQDRELYASIKKLNKPTIIAVNKVDTLQGQDAGDQYATEVAILLEAYGVIPISAKTGANIVEELLPAVIDASPEAALTIGRELPRFRREAAQRIIRSSTLLSLAAGLEPIPFIDIPILLGIQIRLVLRLAALYGEPLDSTNAMLHARELVATLAGGLGLRLLAEQAAKAVPFGGDFVAGAIAGAATWSIGEVALEFYDSGKKMDIRRLRQLYKTFNQRFRNERLGEHLRDQERSIPGARTPGLIKQPRDTVAEEKA